MTAVLPKLSPSHARKIISGVNLAILNCAICVINTKFLLYFYTFYFLFALLSPLQPVFSAFAFYATSFNNLPPDNHERTVMIESDSTEWKPGMFRAKREEGIVLRISFNEKWSAGAVGDGEKRGPAKKRL